MNDGLRSGIDELKEAIAKVAVTLPEVGRSVPKRWNDVREELLHSENAYMPLRDVLDLCYQHKMDEGEANLFVTIMHRLGHIIHYEHDKDLRDIVILKADWLATAISFVLDDKVTRDNNGLAPFSRLSEVWSDPERPIDERYSEDLHPIFLRLMERYDLSYKVAGLSQDDDISLIAQLVRDTRPQEALQEAWQMNLNNGDKQQTQICRIVDEKANSATAEGLFYRLIVRLHKYSLGRVHYNDSVHWQRGLVIDDDYNGRAFLEHIGNDVRITVRAPYPHGLLTSLTNEVRHLVDSFWEGLDCNVMVPCIHPCGQNSPGTGLYKVEQLIDSKRKNRPEFPCPVCNEWQGIDVLLQNAPVASPKSTQELINREVLVEVRRLGRSIEQKHDESMGRFDKLDAGQKAILSQADANYNTFIQVLTDEAKEGPRLFSFIPVERSRLNPREWTSRKFRLTLWCEHSRLPLPVLNEDNPGKGVYELELNRDWFKRAAPFLKILSGTLSLVLPVALSSWKYRVDDATYELFEEELDLGMSIIDASLGVSDAVVDWLGSKDSTSLEQGEAIRAQGSILREFQSILKERDPGFGGLIRVMNKRQEFMWVHPQFEGEY